VPRPRSEITDSGVATSIRMTKSQHTEYIRLGGSSWLRRVLALSIEERRRQEKQDKPL
jgi:hypothetical protein